MKDAKERLYVELIDKSVYVVLRANYQRNGLLIEETDQTIKVLGLSRISIIPKEEIAVIDIDRSILKLSKKQESELEKIKSYLESKNKAARQKLHRK